MTIDMNTLPAHIAARVAERQAKGTRSTVAAAVVNEEGLSIPRISIRAGRYRLKEGKAETVVGTTLDTIVVGANPRISKVFYNKQYDQSDDTIRPECWSNDGVRPDPSVENPVNQSCADCPYNVLGSKILPSGAKSKMCADQRHLAVVPAADPTKVYSLTVPVSGMKALREYFKELGAYGIGPEEVITELGFDDSASYPKITFKQKGYVPERAIDNVDKLIASDHAKVATRELSVQSANLLAAPPVHAVLESSKVEAIDDAYEEEEEKPAPSKKAKPAVQPVKSSDELSRKLDSLFD